MRRLSLLFLCVTACTNPGAQAQLDVSSLRARAALTGVPLDRIELTISAPDLNDEVLSIEPDEDRVRVALAPGPARTFSLRAVRVLDSDLLGELPVFVGSTTQDLVSGENDVVV
ncbi:MAG: hypothetical protein AAFY60_01240, partial [Myxococcota bacterium]